MMMRFALLAAVVLFGTFLTAQSVAGGFAISAVVNPVANGRAMAFTPDGRLFYVENSSGNIMIVNNPTSGSSTPVVFATLTDLNVPSSNDLGLHGIAIHPNFPSSGTSSVDRYIYVCYSTGTAGNPSLEVKRFQEDGTTPGTPVSSVPTPIVAAISMGAASNNFGGRITFGPGGELFVTVGDGGSSIALAGGFAQDVSDRRGKVLRYNADGSIPLSNPFTGNAMYAYGMRNPRGMAFNPSTGDLFSTDQGNPASSGTDELNVILPNANYGWDASGNSGTQGVTGYNDPAWDLVSTFDPSCVAFYPTSGTAFPAVGFRGGVAYVGSEATAGSIQRVVLTGGSERNGIAQWTFANGFSSPVRDLQFGPDGNLYVMTDSVLYRIIYNGNSSNDPVANAGTDQTVDENTSVMLDGSGSSDPDVSDVLRYTWKQVGGGVLVTLANPTTATPTFTAPLVTFNQSFTFELIIEDGNGGVSNDFVIINVNNVSNPGDDDGPVSFEPPGEGGCSTGESNGWWWMLLAVLTGGVVAIRATRRV